MIRRAPILKSPLVLQSGIVLRGRFVLNLNCERDTSIDDHGV